MDFAFQLQIYLLLAFAVYSAALLPSVLPLLIRLRDEFEQGNRDLASGLRKIFKK